MGRVDDLTDPKTTLHHYLREQRAGLLAKLDGLSEYDARRPLTASGTNLAGLVKHVASVQLDYLGEVFDRPHGRVLPWFAEGAEPEADLWLTPEETLASVRDLHAFSAAHADATIAALPLDAPGRVPWWRAGHDHVTLHRVLVHLVAETARHAGHADILRESLDGAMGNGPADPNVPDRDTDGWSAHRARVEAAARAAGAADGSAPSA
ncbi:DinB family protein [Cellulomonas triticagri]|uniref:DinB family protein n=1 Tax=Cellulomonas triticagri TaxID=2483352 RepID=A0A3M2IUJ9_9CELL|nr:DinB family protein [Cellulomonas triticagri]RMI03536.1 DinB family protein [Cellulomonas triticagri]